MKVLYKNILTPLWAKILIYSITIICSLISFYGGVYTGIIATVLINAVPFYSFRLIEKREKLKRDNLEKDPFFTKQNYTLGSSGIYTILAVNKETLRIVNVKATIFINRRNYDIVEIYKNYPSKGWQEVSIGAKTAHYIDIPMAEIQQVKAINQGEAGWPFLAKGMNFGIRITTKENFILDVDTTFPNEFSEEITKFLS
jgi:hypothetical protein